MQIDVMSEFWLMYDSIQQGYIQIWHRRLREIIKKTTEDTIAGSLPYSAFLDEQMADKKYLLPELKPAHFVPKELFLAQLSVF